MSMHAGSGCRLGIAKTPSEKDMETAQERSGHYLDAWKVMTGNDMAGGLLSTHKQIELAARVSERALASVRNAHHRLAAACALA